MTFKSTEHKQSGVEYRLVPPDNNIDGPGRKTNCIPTYIWIFLVCLGILICLNYKAVSSLWDASTNLTSDDSGPMCDIVLEQEVQLEKESTINDKNDIKTNADIVQEISPTHKTFSSGSVKKRGANFHSESFTCGCTNATSHSTNGVASKKSKKVLNASQILELLGNFIQITDREEYITHYNTVIKFFINELKTDDTFKYIFKGEVMAGSYRDGLKISKPNEFDTIMRLNFGKNKNLIVERVFDNPGPNCTIKVKEAATKNKPYLKQFLDSDGYLRQDVIIIWIQNLFRRILKPHDENGKIIQIGNHSYHYNHSINGPAFTFKIMVKDTDIKFDMDLVPAIPFDYVHWIATRDYSKDSNQVNWIVVPKSPKRGLQRPYRLFLCSYTEMEKHILKDLNQAKNLIRIFKKLRDNQQFKDLKSYYIKTIFLWQTDNTTIAERKKFWSRPLDVIFLDMFKTIMKHIQNRELLFFWETDYNMFRAVSETKLKFWDDKLRGIYSRLDTILTDNPKDLIDLILTPEERKRLECKHPKLCINQSS